MNKSPQDLELMRSQQRRSQRSDRKSATRASYIKTIPALEGPDFEYLYHSGYASPDESDAELDHAITTKRPEYRSSWENNLFEAIRIAQSERTQAKLGSSYRPPVRRVVIVDRPIPRLERGKGGAKTIIRIAICGLSKSWREAHSQQLESYTHLINTKAANKPIIHNFLTQYPLMRKEKPKIQEASETSSQSLPASSTSFRHQAGPKGNAYLGEDMGDQPFVYDQPEDCPKSANEGFAGSKPELSLTQTDNFPINPQLEADSEWSPINASDIAITEGAKISAPTLLPMHSNTSASQELDSAHNSYLSVYEFQMPPPPPLPADTDTTPASPKASRKSTRSHPTGNKGSTEVSAPEPKRRGRPRASKLNQDGEEEPDESQPVAETEPKSAQPKKRGRPPGSRNANK
ncbi:unnamed protein product [Rhizoctonia solani]|uniref:Uncharacterized protein n=1 Tax=Rhizoctonia solani TaxID=456999 RepID=A0A8H2Y0E6_9AGAM|nr:unnamed protein product [Rhizoctonia solani]